MKVRVERVKGKEERDNKHDVMAKELDDIMSSPDCLLTFAVIAQRYDMTEDELGNILIDSHIVYKNTEGRWVVRNDDIMTSDYVENEYEGDCKEVLQLFTQKGRLLIHACMADWQPKMMTKYMSYLKDIKSKPTTCYSIEEIAKDYYIPTMKLAEILIYEGIVRKTVHAYVPTDKMLKEQYAIVVDRMLCVDKDGGYMNWFWYFTQKGRLLVHEIAHKYYII